MKRQVTVIVMALALGGCESLGWERQLGGEPDEEEAEPASVEVSEAPDPEDVVEDEPAAEEEPAEPETESTTAASATEEDERAAEPVGDDVAAGEDADVQARAEPDPEPEPESEPEPEPESQPEPAEQTEPASEPSAETAASTEASAADGGADVTIAVIKTRLDSHPDLSATEHPPLTDEEYRLIQNELDRRLQAGEDISKYQEEIERGRSEGGVMAWFYRHWLQ